MRKLAALLFVVLSSSAYADLVFDWTGECSPARCVAAYGTFVVDSSYVPGTEISEPVIDQFGDILFSISPRVKSYSLTFDRGLVHADVVDNPLSPIPAIGPPTRVVETFSYDAATHPFTEPRHIPLLIGSLPVSGPSSLVIWSSSDLAFSLWGTHTVAGPGHWYGWSEHPGIFDYLLNDRIYYPIGPASTFTLRQVSEPATLALVLLAGRSRARSPVKDGLIEHR
jgi:hypothetical protein